VKRRLGKAAFDRVLAKNSFFSRLKSTPFFPHLAIPMSKIIVKPGLSLQRFLKNRRFATSIVTSSFFSIYKGTPKADKSL